MQLRRRAHDSPQVRDEPAAIALEPKGQHDYQAPSRYRVSMDIGGTFTDTVCYDEATGAFTSGKVSTTPSDPSIGVLEGIKMLVHSPEGIAFTVHGTTVGLNALLQRRGERVLLLASSGSEHVYHIARGHRTRIHDIHYRKPQPLVPLEDIFPIRGRLDAGGSEVEPLERSDLEAVVERLRSGQYGSVAIAFLFSYVNPSHEMEAAAFITAALPGIHISLSHRVAGEWREYERTSSTVVDAFIAPTVGRYLRHLEAEMASVGCTADLHVMQSSGGMLSARAAREAPLHTLLSGPVGGAMGGSALAKEIGRNNLICVDMGGTSFDISLVMGGRPEISSQATLEGFPLLMPVVTIHTIGAGGGSLAYLEGGGLRVGPQSAGAEPGPACYGRGGSQPTVTDANVVLGRIDPNYFLNGRMSLDVGAAEAAVDSLASQLGIGRLELAEGIIDIINAKMAQGIRRKTVEQGIEPRDFSLVAFGGAGPLHCAFLASELDIHEVIVPVSPGTLSAWGMLQARIRHDFSRPYFRRAGTASRAEIDQFLSDLEGRARQALRSEGVTARHAVLIERSAEMRYEGQEYTVNVSLPHSGADADLAATISAFHDAYLTRYGHANAGAPVEFVTLRLSGTGDLGQFERERPAPPLKRTYQPTSFREVYFGRKLARTAITARGDLTAGDMLKGPAIIEEPTSTTVVPPQWVVSVDEIGNLVLARSVS